MRCDSPTSLPHPNPSPPDAPRAQVSVSKEHITIVGDGRTQAEVEARVKQIKNLLEAADAEYEKEKLNERIARLSGGVAVIQVGKEWLEAELLGC